MDDKNKIIDLEQKLSQAVQQYDEVVKQNRSLQAELNLESKSKIIAFLTEMSSQNNRGTAFPYYYCISYEKPTYQADCCGDHIYDSDNCDMTSIEHFIETYNDDYGTDFDFNNIDIDDFLEEHHPDFRRYSKDYETVYDNFFLTESDAKEHLEKNSHHYGKDASTYVKYMYRANKTEQFLTDLFNFFGVKIPPEMYYENEDKAGA